jgi:decaprenyl-phosphate phosphoribosyltransferase
MLGPVIKSLRPHQWVKNVFVAGPVVFARRIGDPTAVLRTAAAFGIFCVLSSAVYLVNDLVDIEKDRAHPVKRRRPIAAGEISPATARLLAAVLALGGLAASLALGPAFLGIAAGYLALNAGYSLALKRIAFVDVGCLSLGFLLRVLAGAFAIPVAPSRWLLICTLLLSALLGFGKRAHELRVSGEGKTKQRDVLSSYDPKVLRVLLLVLGVATAAAYLGYTWSVHASQVFGAGRLVYTVPFVGFGVYRYIWIVSHQSEADSPTDSMLHDFPFVANLVLYAIAVVTILYVAR